MAFRLEIQKTTSTPYILVDEENGYMKMEGRSFHENIAEFYREVTNWLDSYLMSDFGIFTFDCAMDYFNSSTVKALLNMLTKMNKNTSNGKKITVNWITTADNEIVIECGEDFQEEATNITFNLVINQ